MTSTISKAAENMTNKAQQGLHAFIKEYCQDGFTKACFDCRLFNANPDIDEEYCKVKRVIDDLNDIIFYETE